jgi:2-C-methyl-D-erythritol 2,4-cyclodiphosphate synthase
MRIGHGYDAHRLVSGRALILGGVSIPHDRGLLAHSDGDALIHAICDALLGAAALGDIGKFFPDTQPVWKGVDSRVLLREVVAMLARKGFRIANVDATIVAQRPKLAPHFPAMRENLAADLKIAIDRVSVKGTTTEGMGFAGREEGIAAHAVALLEE